MSIRVSRQLTAAAVFGWFAAELGRGQQISIDSYWHCIPAINRHLLPKLWLQSTSSLLDVRPPRHATIADRSFATAGPRIWMVGWLE